MNTVLLLLAEHGTAHLPLEKVGECYLGVGKDDAYRKAVSGALPFAAFKLGRKWIVDIRDLATWIDSHRLK